MAPDAPYIVSMKKRILLAGLSCLIGLSNFVSSPVFLLPAQGQVEYWNNEARKRSQNLSSSALNHLKNINAGKNRSRSSKKAGDLVEAVRLLEKAIQIDPEDPLPHYLLGIALAMQEKYDKTLPLLQKANKLDPREEEILLATGLAQHLSGNYEKAISIWQKLLSRTSRKAPILVCIGHARLRQGELEEAVETFSKAHEQEPGLQAAHEGMAKVYFIAGDLEKARVAAEHAQSIESYPPVELLLAEIAYLEGDRSSAENHLKAWKRGSGKTKPNKSMTQIGFSRQHDFRWDPFIVDDFDSAEAMRARNSIRQAPEKASRYAGKSSLRSIEAKVDTALSNKPSDFYLKHQKGLIALAGGNKEEALKSLRESISMCPGNQVDLLNLVLASGNLGGGAWLKRYRSVYPDARLASTFDSLVAAPEADSTKETPAPQKKSQNPDEKKTEKKAESAPSPFD